MSRTLISLPQILYYSSTVKIKKILQFWNKKWFSTSFQRKRSREVSAEQERKMEFVGFAFSFLSSLFFFFLQGRGSFCLRLGLIADLPRTKGSDLSNVENCSKLRARWFELIAFRDRIDRNHLTRRVLSRAVIISNGRGPPLFNSPCKTSPFVLRLLRNDPGSNARAKRNYASR